MILVFNICRLIQFLFSGIIGLQLVQSNLVCVILSAIALGNLWSQSSLCILASLVITLDALLGTAIFVTKNEKEIKSTFSFVSKITSFKTSTRISAVNISYGDDSFGSVI